MPKYFGCFSRISAAGTELKGISSVEGASDSKTLLFCHSSWYFFSIAIKTSRLCVCEASVRSSGCSLVVVHTHILKFESFGRTLSRVHGDLGRHIGGIDSLNSTPLDGLSSRRFLCRAPRTLFLSKVGWWLYGQLLENPQWLRSHKMTPIRSRVQPSY